MVLDKEEPVSSACILMNMNISKEDDRSGALLSEAQGCGGEAAAGGWVRGIGCGTCNDSSIEKDGRACEAAGSWQSSPAL